jgi:hypothetical protein
MFRPLISLGLLLSLAIAMAAQSQLPDAPSAINRVHHSQFNPNSPLLADDPYRPLTSHAKFDAWVHQTYRPTTFLGVGVDTVFASATGGFHYCCGGEAWAKQYAASMADTQARRFFGNFLFPVLLHQDPRYLPKRKGSVLSRAWYAATRVVVTRSDDGRSVPNTSEFLSVAFSKALCNAYYPEHDRTGNGTFERIYTTFQSDATDNLLNEFWPDIKNLFKRHTPKRIASFAQKMSLSGKGSD